MGEERHGISWVLYVAAVAGALLAFGGYYMYQNYIAPLYVGNESLEPFPDDSAKPAASSAGGIELISEFDGSVIQ